MFASNYLTQRNSQSNYENTLRPTLSQYNNIPNDEQLSRNEILTQNSLIHSQVSNFSNNMARQGTQQSICSTNNYINYKQFENILVENIKAFPEQVNECLTNSKENNNLKLLMKSIDNTSFLTFQNFDKINNTFCAKLTTSNICVESFLEMCEKLNILLNSIDNELLNQFSTLTSFHGYDESFQNEEKNNLKAIENAINKCNELLCENIIKVNNNSMNFNNEINNNIIQLNRMLSEEMNILGQNINELIKHKKERNINSFEYQNIFGNIINLVNSLKNKFIFLYPQQEKIQSIDMIEKSEDNKINMTNEIPSSVDNMNITEEVKLQNKEATMKIISEMHKRNRKNKNKFHK